MESIPLFKPYINAKARENVAEVLNGTAIAEGPRVQAFEAAFGEIYGVGEPVALNSGTSALELALHMAGVGPGDDIIVPVLGHPANFLYASRIGARVHFCDILDTLTADPLHVKQLAESCNSLKAIVYVHFGGSSASLKDVKDVADHFGVPLIEDAAQCSPDDNYGLGDYVCFSLQAIKFLTAGDGGVLSCKTHEETARAKRLRWFGFDRSAPADSRDIVEAGFKFHMNDISAAMAHGNLEGLRKDVLEPRLKISKLYRNARLPLLTYSWLTILIHPKAMLVQKVLRDNGVGCGQQHFRLDKLALFTPYPHALPNMDRLEKQYLMLPFHHAITERDVERILQYVRTAIA